MLGLFRKKRPAEPNVALENPRGSLKDTIITNAALGTASYAEDKAWPQDAGFQIFAFMEAVFFLLHALDRYAFELGGAPLRDSLMEENFVGGVIDDAFWKIMDTSRSTQEEVRQAQEVRGYVLVFAAEAEVQYGSSKAFMLPEATDGSHSGMRELLKPDSVLGVFIERVMKHTAARLDLGEDGPKSTAYRVTLYKSAVQMLVLAKLKEKAKGFSR